jgi:hypothetical protein
MTYRELASQFEDALNDYLHSLEDGACGATRSHLEDLMWDNKSLIGEALKLAVAARSSAGSEPITTEQLDKLQFGRSLHERPAVAQRARGETVDELRETLDRADKHTAMLMERIAGFESAIAEAHDHVKAGIFTLTSGNKHVPIEFHRAAQALHHALNDASPQAAAEPDVEARIAVLSDALKSILKNTYCDNCREAALVARSALASYVGLARTAPQAVPSNDDRYIGYRDEHGRRLLCSHKHCPAPEKCIRGCLDFGPENHASTPPQRARRAVLEPDEALDPKDFAAAVGGLNNG